MRYIQCYWKLFRSFLYAFFKRNPQIHYGIFVLKTNDDSDYGCNTNSCKKQLFFMRPCPRNAPFLLIFHLSTSLTDHRCYIHHHMIVSY